MKTRLRLLVAFDGIAPSRRSRRELAWALRHDRGWDLARIGARLGIKAPAVSRLLRREEHRRVAVVEEPVIGPTDPRALSRRRALKPLSLSESFNA